MAETQLRGVRYRITKGLYKGSIATIMGRDPLWPDDDRFVFVRLDTGEGWRVWESDIDTAKLLKETA